MNVIKIEEKEKIVSGQMGCGEQAVKVPYIPDPKYEPSQDTLIAFESGHYKAFKGVWKGDSVWAHFETLEGKTIHINKDKVEYIQRRF
jgi:hypothetical protein